MAVGQLLDIALDGSLRINTYIGRDCYNVSGQRQPPVFAYATLTAFPFSITRNKFTAVGCDTLAMVNGAKAAF